MSVSERPLTGLLRAWGDGDLEARDRVLSIVYQDLRGQASRYLRRERAGHTLEPTALVHEAYLRLVPPREPWQSRAHFFAVAAQAMRRILVDHARRRASIKRGGALTRVTLEAGMAVGGQREVDLLALDEALEQLSELDPRQAQIVELRFFGGLSIEETSAALGASPTTIKRDWSLARAWLHRKLRQGARTENSRSSPRPVPRHER